MLNVSQNTLDALSQNTEFCNLVKLDLSPTPLYLTDCNHDVLSNLNLYQSNGLLLEFDALEFKSELSVGTVKMKFSAVDPTLLSLFLNRNQVNAEVSISVAFLNEGLLVDEALPIWSGSITASVITESETAIIEVSAASIWADFQKKAGRRSTEASQQKLFPSDKGMSFAAVTGREYKWGS